MTGGRRRPLAGLVLCAGALLLALGCSAVLGLGDYAIDKDGGATAGDTSTDEDSSIGEAGCDVDLAVQCHPCEPTSDIELLNACTEGNCIQFDRARLTPLLLPDGGLPPLPATPPGFDAGPADAADGGG